MASHLNTQNLNSDVFLPPNFSSSFILSPVDQSQVNAILSSLSSNKASFDIPNHFLKLVSHSLSIPLTQLYNESIESGLVPDVFKIAKVTLIFKSGQITEPGNYRPISLASPFSKVLERLVYEQLIKFLDKHNILYNYQFGFRKSFTTEQAILELTDNFKSSVDAGEHIFSIFLDLSKAFDIVDHQIIIKKLYRYGIRGTPLLRFESYLQNRKQYVEIDNIKSSLLNNKCGVPQGSTLGPLLFLLYINDLHNCLGKSNARIFDDDTTLFYSSKDPMDVQNTIYDEFQSLLNYCTDNKLSVNF